MMQFATVTGPRCAEPQRGILSFLDRYGATWVGFLLFLYFIFGFVGSNPLSGGAAPSVTGGTNLVRQMLLIGLFCGALPILLVYRRRAVQILRDNLLPLAAYVWLAATALWSMHPPLTIRRVVAEVLVLGLLVAVVSVMRSWKVIVYPIVAAAVMIVLADITAVVVAPGLAIGPIGAMGVHTNKNLAGVITMIALILCGGTFLANRDGRVRAVLLPVIVLGFIFLVLTKSKTSLGLIVLTYATVPALYLVFKRWSAAPVIVPAALISAAALALVVVAGFGIPRSDVLEFVFGDATLTRRTELWAFLQTSIDQRPYLGWGWGAFWDTGAPINPINAPPRSWVLPANEINTAHSGYIDIWLQSGLIGLLIVLAMIGRAVWVYTSLLRQRHWGVETDRLIATMFAVVVALTLYNFLESLLFRPADCLSGLFVLCLLAGETSYQQSRRTIGATSDAAAVAPASPWSIHGAATRGAAWLSPRRTWAPSSRPRPPGGRSARRIGSA